jgi:uncharacterized protein YecE (DUF72 family)
LATFAFTAGITRTGSRRIDGPQIVTTTFYSFRELESWADRVRTISEKRRESVFVVTTNHFEGKAVVNALQLTALLMDRPVSVPEQLLMRYPELREISEKT